MTDEMNEMIEGVQKPACKCEEYLAGWKRAQADYLNLQKETERQKRDIVAYANENLLHELLPAIDHFETALSHVPDLEALPEEGRMKWKSWVGGIQAVKQFWDMTFKPMGLERIDTSGSFDPAKHEAVSTEEHPDMPADAIVRVTQPGWQLNGKVLRAAKVVVNAVESR